jgi:two-component system chemotaxis response regulator CheY
MMPLWFADSQENFHETPSIGVKSQEKLDGKNPESSNPVSILIVDDNVDCRMILRTAIEREGFCCVEATDGMAALKLFQEITIDFIITDFQMPHMNGCEFLEVLSREAVSCPPTVMITGNLSDSVRMRAMHAGALAVLSKPFDQKKILKIVREVVHRKQEALH